MRVLFFIIVSFFVTSCAHHVEKNNILHKEYNAYISALNTKNYSLALDMFSLRNVERFKNPSNTEEFTLFFPFFSAANTSIDNVVSHYQTIKNGVGCLTINGFDSSGPLSLSFEFLREKEQWKFNYIYYIYHSTESDFPSSAFCPVNP